MFETPILYIIFNRIDTVQQTFPVIKKQKPKHLYVAADGPRIEKSGEAEKCNQVRNWVLSQIDWDCEVKTLFREDNLGCGKGPASAISWFFENVEQGIILEDDCLPADSFFPFCETLLEKYKDDERIGMISGRNNLTEIKTNFSFAFTTGGGIWGWATWRNRWKTLFTLDCPIFYQHNELLKKIYEFTKDKEESKHLSVILSEKSPIDDAWDYQWGTLLKINKRLSITPKVNLVVNIGFITDSTHFHTNTMDFASLKSINFPLVYPKKIKPNYKTSKCIARFCYPKNHLLNKIIKKIKKTIKGFF